ncbi:MAG: hypothetical protein Q9224_005387 [Gallowayella concinna]
MTGRVPSAGGFPPLGPPPEDGDRHRGADIIVTQFVFTSIAAVLICLRLYVRAKITRKAVTIPGTAFNVMMIREGFGRHLYYLKQTPKQIPRAMFWHIIWPGTFLLSVTLTRISICGLLLRIFGVNRTWRRCLWGVIAFLIVINIPSFIMVFTQCRPYAKSWNPQLPGHCWAPDNNVRVALYSGICAVLQDWLLATIPIACLWNMQIGKRQKVGICALMSLGYFSGVCAIVRTVISMQVFNAGGLADFSWTIIDLRIWGVVENLVGIIAASAPTLKPLFVAARGSSYWPGSKKSGSGSKGYVAHNNSEGIAPSQRKTMPADPYATTLLGTEAGGGGSTRLHHDKGKDQIRVRTDIELDDYHDQRPMVSKLDPVYHGV